MVGFDAVECCGCCGCVVDVLWVLCVMSVYIVCVVCVVCAVYLAYTCFFRVSSVLGCLGVCWGVFSPHTNIVLGWWVGHILCQVCLYRVDVKWVSYVFRFSSSTVKSVFLFSPSSSAHKCRVGLVGVSLYSHNVSLWGGCVVGVLCVWVLEFNRRECQVSWGCLARHTSVGLGWWGYPPIATMCLYTMHLLWVSYVFGFLSLTVESVKCLGGVYLST